MEIGTVIGSVWATKKNEHLEGQKLLVIRTGLEREEKGLIVGVDIIGAGIGDQVLVVHGSAARCSIGKPSAPVDVAVVGIIDKVEVDKNEYK
ncbi:MAG TPA: EutN/CcmL family microcompartment protein [Candidatus Merdenecus merdavium]|nr:EutN/CcmL family microcompartment protein [Candidatus Merdenecus merdavium]